MKRKYYSIRTGKHPAEYNLETLKKLFLNLYNSLEREGYFQEQFGYYCIDADFGGGWVFGELGEDIVAVVFNTLLKDRIWPISKYINLYSEDDLFDTIEFLFDHVSRPVEGYNHSYGGCGMHYSKFNKTTGQEKFREEVNEILGNYNNGFEMSQQGQILVREEKGLTDIFKAEVITPDKDIQLKIDLAVQKYRGSRSDMEERRIAIRELADILESLRSNIKEFMLSSDDGALFNIANNFYIRHSNEKQVKKYDKNIWYSWIFYLYLSTIHTLLRLLDKYKKS